MRYFTRKGYIAFTIITLALLTAACGSEKENTIVSTTAPSTFYSHSVAFRNNEVFTWGANTYGQLGNGDNNPDHNQYTPVPVVGVNKAGFLTGISGVSTGGTHVLAFNSSAGNVFSWGNNGDGQLGDNSLTAREAPVQVVTDTSGAFLSGVTAVSAGFSHSLALKGDKVWAWGNNGFGQLGNNTTTTSLIAVPVTSLSLVSKIAAGGEHSLALINGTAWSWGYNASGQLGLGSTTIGILPQPVLGLSQVTDIAAGGSHSLFIADDEDPASLYACGINKYGQLGDGTTDNRTSVVRVKKAGGPFLTGVIAVAAGLDHTLVLLSDHTVWAWGFNFFGQLGDGTASTFNTFTPQKSPVPVVDIDGNQLSGISKIVAIGHKSFAVTADGKLYAWGDNSFGQLGLAVNDTKKRNRATQVPPTTGAIYNLIRLP